MQTMTCLCNAGSVQQLQPIEREQLGQDLNILHMCFTVTTTIVLFGPVQPGHYISTQVAIVKAAHLQGIQKHSQCGQ